MLAASAGVAGCAPTPDTGVTAGAPYPSATAPEPEPGPGPDRPGASPAVAQAGPVPPAQPFVPPPAPAQPPPDTGAANPQSPSTAAPDGTTPVGDGSTVVTFAFSGDILPHSPLWTGAARNARAADRDGFDFAPMFAALAALHDRVDLAVCHLETPIAPAGEERSTYPYYGVPAEIADAIAAAHFDRCSTASNHTFDRGVAGIERTVGELARVGVAQDGMARELAEIAPRVFTVDGVPIAHLAYTYSYNGIVPPAGEAWRSRLIDPDRILADAAEARRLGAELVILSLHWGAEGRTEPTDAQRQLADRLTASGLVDLIVGHHAHVVQPIEQVNGVWVIYGMGNLLSNMPTGPFGANSQDGMVVSIAAVRSPAGEFVWLEPDVAPTWVDRHDGWQIRVLADELVRPDLGPARRSVLQASFDRTAAVVGQYLAD